jgi:hypothetical protein
MTGVTWYPAEFLRADGRVVLGSGEQRLPFALLSDCEAFGIACHVNGTQRG